MVYLSEQRFDNNKIFVKVIKKNFCKSQIDQISEKKKRAGE